jgi:hypothetical protein
MTASVATFSVDLVDGGNREGDTDSQGAHVEGDDDLAAFTPHAPVRRPLAAVRTKALGPASTVT